VEALLVERLALLGEVDVAREIRRSELLEGPLVHQAGGVGGDAGRTIRQHQIANAGGGRRSDVGPEAVVVAHRSARLLDLPDLQRKDLARPLAEGAFERLDLCIFSITTTGNPASSE
jgi:hypothetical protein